MFPLSSELKANGPWEDQAKMIEDSITVLEERVRDLEMKVFGQNDQIPDISSSVVDDLLESHKVVSTAISGRDKMSTMASRLEQLERALDPMYEDSVVDTAAKLAFILSMEQSLSDITSQLMRIGELSPCLESDELRNIPQLVLQMSKLTSTLIEIKEKHDLDEERIDELINKYTEIISGITSVFATLDHLVTELEIQAKPKKVID